MSENIFKIIKRDLKSLNIPFSKSHELIKKGFVNEKDLEWEEDFFLHLEKIIKKIRNLFNHDLIVKHKIKVSESKNVKWDDIDINIIEHENIILHVSMDQKTKEYKVRTIRIVEKDLHITLDLNVCYLFFFDKKLAMYQKSMTSIKNKDIRFKRYKEGSCFKIRKSIKLKQNEDAYRKITKSEITGYNNEGLLTSTFYSLSKNMAFSDFMIRTPLCSLNEDNVKTEIRSLKFKNSDFYGTDMKVKTNKIKNNIVDILVSVIGGTPRFNEDLLIIEGVEQVELSDSKIKDINNLFYLLDEI